MIKIIYTAQTAPRHGFQFNLTYLSLSLSILTTIFQVNLG